MTPMTIEYQLGVRILTLQKVTTWSRGILLGVFCLPTFTMVLASEHKILTPVNWKEVYTTYTLK